MNDKFKALADPNRRKILSILKNGEHNVGQLMQHFEITGASLSHHLSILKSAKLIQSEKQGQNVIYSLNTTVLDDVLDWIYQLKDSKKEG